MIKNKICVIGLGYVGLPIFIKLSKYYNTYGYDISKKRVKDLKNGEDKNNEFKKSQLKKNSNNFLYNLNKEDFNFYIVTVPTPIFANKKPDLNPLKSVILNVSKIINNLP